MLDIKFIRENVELVKTAARHKNSRVDIDALLKVDQERRELLAKIESLNQKRNEAAKVKDIAAGQALKAEFGGLEAKLKAVGEQFQALMWQVPNIPSSDTPVGAGETDNQVVRKWGQPKKFTFKPKEHSELGHDLDLIDTERAAKVTGARFNYLKGDLVLLQFALVQFVMNVLTDESLLKKIIKKAGLKVKPTPFVPILPPTMMRSEVMQKMARLEPREERYHLTADDLYLIGSAEHTLGPLHMDETIPEEKLPIRYLGYSVSYRREAGTYGKDTQGILRVHQFDKLEMETFTTSEQGVEEQNFLVAVQEYLTQALEIPYQIVMCCTGDQGDPDARHLDLEMWLPGQGQYRETHSADYMADFQARRLNTKVKRVNNQTEFIHMNDATAFAMSRTPVAILENYQQADGTVLVPKVLRKYLGKKIISKI